jgi:RND family efflux transporter MFP subunit
MKYGSAFRIGSALVFGICLGLTGCARAPSEGPAAVPIPITVSYPVEREVTDYADFTARTAAVDSVEVRAHVWGYLDKVNFKEGALVKKGEVLFEIDPRTYQAMLNQAKAKVAQDEAQLKYDEAEYKRNLRLAATGAVSQSDLDKTSAARGVDLANVAADKAMVASRQLDLDYTKVTAPVSGRVSRYVVTVGNLIQSGDQNGGTLLTTIVSVDPIYAYYDVDERTVQRVSQLIREGKVKWAQKTEWPVSLGLATEEGFPHQGTVNFVDNQVNPKTGTLRVRGGSAPACGCPSVHPTRPCWSANAPSTPTRARKSSTSSTKRTRWSPAPFGWGRSTTACGPLTTA